MPKLLKVLAVMATGLCFSGAVWAHGSFGETKSVVSGGLHFLTSPLCLVALLGLVVVLVGAAEKTSFAGSLLAGMVAGVVALLPGFFPPLVAPLCVVALGLGGVFGWKPGSVGAVALALCAGFASGMASNLDTPNWRGSIGVALCLMFMSQCALSLAHEDAIKQRLHFIPTIAGRVLGSWVLAIGLLLAVLSLKTGR